MSKILRKNPVIGLLVAGLLLALFAIFWSSSQNSLAGGQPSAALAPIRTVTNTQAVPVQTVTPILSPTATVPALTATLVPTPTPSFFSGVYDFNNEVVYSDAQKRLTSPIARTDLDPRLGKILDPHFETVIWLPGDQETLEKEGVKLTKVYRSSDGEAIVSMSADERKPSAVFVEAAKIKPAQTPSETEKLFIAHLNEDLQQNFNSFEFMGQLSETTFQIDLVGLVISDPKAPNHTLTVNGHIVNYVDMLIILPGRGLVKVGLAMGSDNKMSPDHYLVPQMFRGAQSHDGPNGTIRNEHGYVGLFSLPTKIIFASGNTNNYAIKYTLDQWYKSVDVSGMPLLEFGAPSGYTGINPAKESIRYLPYLPSNYYEKFLRTGGDDFVVFFPGSDISFGTVKDFGWYFNDEELSLIRKEWDVNGNQIK